MHLHRKVGCKILETKCRWACIIHGLRIWIYESMNLWIFIMDLRICSCWDPPKEAHLFPSEYSWMLPPQPWECLLGAKMLTSGFCLKQAFLAHVQRVTGHKIHGFKQLWVLTSTSFREREISSLDHKSQLSSFIISVLFPEFQATFIQSSQAVSLV